MQAAPSPKQRQPKAYNQTAGFAMSSSGVESSGLRSRGPKTGKAAAEDVPPEKLPEFQADFVVVVSTKKDGESNVRDVLVKLANGGFYVAVVSGAGKTVQVLVRISPERLAAAAKESQARDWAAGVETDEIGIEHESLTPATRQRLVYEALRTEGTVVGLHKAVVDVYPLADKGVSDQVWKTGLFGLIPDYKRIKLQYGEEAALYFAFLQYAIKSAVIPAIIGTVARFTVGAYNGIVGSLLLSWAVVFLLLWRRREKELAARWNTLEVVNIATKRAGWRGTKPRTRQLRRLLFIPVAAMLCSVYVVSLILSLGFEVFATQLYNGPYRSVIGLMPTAVNIVLAQIFGIGYGITLDRFLAWEDYDTEEEYSKAKTQRKFFAAFFLNYTPLFLSAYLYLPFGHNIIDAVAPLQSALGPQIPIKTFELNRQRLAAQTQYYAVTNQIVGALSEGVAPAVILAIKKRVSKDHKPGAKLRAYQSLPPYDVNVDYLGVASLFGYLMILSPVWPLVPVAALAGLLVRAKISAARLAFETRKPVPRRVNSIGAWNSYLLFLGGVASITISTLTAMYGWNPCLRTGCVRVRGESLIETSAVVILALALFSENVFLGSVKLVESLFNGAPLPMRTEKPSKQTAAPSEGTPSDLAWKNHDVSVELRNIFANEARQTK